MTRHPIRPALVLVAAAFALVGCATTTQMQQQELRDPTRDESLVIGSVSIRGGTDILGRTRWELWINKAERTTFIAPDYSIQAHRGGDEEVFAVTMPVGDYRIVELRQPGFSTFRMDTNVSFRVEPGKTTYIGRLVIEFPQETITVFTPIRITVENAKDPSVATAKDKYRKHFDDVTTSLMVVRSTLGPSLPGRTTADPRLEADTLFTIMGMDRAEAKDCNQRAVADRAVISTDSKGAVEHWTINRCGLLIRYRITYSPGPGGGTLIGYTPGEVVGKVR